MDVGGSLPTTATPLTDEFECPDKADELCSSTMEMMDRLGIPPTPSDYLTWYIYFAGPLPHLNLALDQRLRSKEPFDRAEYRGIHRQFFASVVEAQTLATSAQDFETMLRQIGPVLEKTGVRTDRYREVLNGASTGLSSGALGESLEPLVAGLVETTARMKEEVQVLELTVRNASKEIDRLRATVAKVRRESEIDPLTQVANRKFLDQALEEAVDWAERTGDPLSLIMTDLDHFKRFNDTYGHQAGDDLLRLVARVLRGAVRDHDIVARYGGEEFCLVLPQANLSVAAGIAARLRSNVANRQIVRRKSGDKLGGITLSLGVAAHIPSRSVDDLVQEADSALYAAKRAGRNRVVTEQELA